MTRSACQNLRKHRVGTVAERHLVGLFAGAPGNHFCLRDLDFLWLQAGPLVRSITKRLALRTPAGAPPINARLDFLDDRRFLRDDRFSHIPQFSPFRLADKEDSASKNELLAQLRTCHQAQTSLRLFGKICEYHRHMITSVFVPSAGNNHASTVNLAIITR